MGKVQDVIGLELLKEREFTFAEKTLMNKKLKEFGLTPMKFDRDYNRILKYLKSKGA